MSVDSKAFENKCKESGIDYLCIRPEHILLADLRGDLPTDTFLVPPFLLKRTFEAGFNLAKNSEELEKFVKD